MAEYDDGNDDPLRDVYVVAQHTSIALESRFVNSGPLFPNKKECSMIVDAKEKKQNFA